MRSNNSKQTAKNNQQVQKQTTLTKKESQTQQGKPETPKKPFQRSSSSLMLNMENELKQQNQETPKEPAENIMVQEGNKIKNEEKPAEFELDKQEQMLVTDGNEQADEINNSTAKVNQEKIQDQVNEIVDAKYGDQKIDLSDLKDSLQDLQNNKFTQGEDPTRPQNLNLDHNANEPLPSFSNRVNLGEFSVGNYKEYQLKEELANLIEKYNKQFNPHATKPNLHKGEIQNTKETKYQDKMITNPIAVPDPGSSEGNFSWMYLITPYYNQLVKEFGEKQMENHVLQQHFEYYNQMQQEKVLLNEEFELLKQSERALMEKVTNCTNENQVLEDKVRNYERNLTSVQPERIREVNDKLDNLSNILAAKDGVIDQLLNEISLIKNEKDDLQNEVLFKKQRIENYNIEFNTKELEYQRLWEEQQNLKSEIRGDTNDSKQLKRENDMLQREIANQRDEIAQNSSIYDQVQYKIQEQKQLIIEYENRLRYANDVIMGLETEGQQINLDLAQAKATVEGQNRAYNELRTNFYLLNNSSGDAQRLQFNNTSQMLSIPKIVSPSNFYKPSLPKAIINLAPSTSKALSQQTAPTSIKSYLSVKKATIDLTSDLRRENNTGGGKGVRFSNVNEGSSPNGGMSNLPAQGRNLDYAQSQRRSDSMDLRIEKRNLKGILMNDNENQMRQSMVSQQQQANPRTSSVNRNFVDSMSGLLGMSEDKQKLLNVRASQASAVFPLRKVDLENVDQSISSPLKGGYGSPDKSYRPTMETDASTDYLRSTMNPQGLDDSDYRQSINSNMWTQTPTKNKMSMRGGPGNRSTQPQQINSVKQRQNNRHQVNAQEEEKYRQSTWGERMSQLPKQSAYKSSITFEQDGMTVKETQRKSNVNNYQDQNDYYQQSQQPFQMAKDYDIDIDALNEDDPQAKMQIIKFKQQKIFELQDQRKLLQSQVNHIPDYSKQVSQRQKKQELDAEIQKLTKRISMMKYDLKKLNSKAIDD